MSNITKEQVIEWLSSQSVIDLADPLSSNTCTDPNDASTCANLFGIGVPLALSIGLMAVGVVLMVIWMVRSPEFFRQRPGTFHDVREPA